MSSYKETSCFQPKVIYFGLNRKKCKCLCRLVEGGVNLIMYNATVEVDVGGEVSEVLNNSDVAGRHLRDLLLRNGNNKVGVSHIIGILVECN